MGGFNMGAFHMGIGIYTYLVLLFYLILGVLLVGFLVSGIRFFKEKTQNDKILIAKLDDLVRIHQEQSRRNGGMG